jgi:hypothetical protein
VSTTSYRCSAASLEAGEPSGGTASTVRRFLLVEQPGPWGVDAVRDSRLPDPVKQHLTRLRDEIGIRPLLVRPCRSAPARPGVQVFLADAPTGTLRGRTLDRVEDLVDLDLTSLEVADGPLFLVCTHGRHDACCAERGRPMAAALAAVDPVHTWEVSHIGGDRFAPNVLVLPDGLYYGRLDPDTASELVARHLDGRLDLAHLRGRSTLPFAAQAAELHLRRETGDERLEAPGSVRSTRSGEHRVVELGLGGRTWRVRMRPVVREAALLTCRASRESVAVSWELVGLEELDGPDRSPPAGGGHG